MGILTTFVFEGHSLELKPVVISAATNSIMLAIAVAILVVLSAAFLGLIGTYQGDVAFRRIAAVASAGYAFPGTILAIGVVTAGGNSSDYRTRVTMNWVKEGGKWVVKSQHYSPANYGGVHQTQAADFED